VLPLINVVFLLLVFFMVAGRLTPPDAFPLTPPRSAAEGVAAEGVTVALTADGRVAVDGVEVAPEAAAEAVRRAQAEAPGAPLVVRADAAAPGPTLVALLARLEAAGIAGARLVSLRRAP
jgi:biopolymer transport protein ExbD